jgi:hypothetical protein
MVHRICKIHLGVRVQKKNEKGEIISEYPSQTDYFVCPAELLQAMGLPEDAQVKELNIMFPSERIEDIAPQWYRRWSRTKGLT